MELNTLLFQSYLVYLCLFVMPMEMYDFITKWQGLENNLMTSYWDCTACINQLRTDSFIKMSLSVQERGIASICSGLYLGLSLLGI